MTTNRLAIGGSSSFKSAKPASWWLEGARRTGDAKLIKAWEDAVNGDWDALHYDPDHDPLRGKSK